jgi:hypothetical protein
MAAIILMVVGACDLFPRPVVDKKDDGEIWGKVVANKKEYEKGETVEITFTIKNTSNETVILERDDKPVQDILLISSPDVKLRWSEETGHQIKKLRLKPGETSSIEWKLNDLDTNSYSLMGMWWSADTREDEVIVRIEYGPARY